MTLAVVYGHVVDVSDTSAIVMAGDVGYELTVHDPKQYKIIQIHLRHADAPKLLFWIWTINVQEQTRMYGFKNAKSRSLALKLADVDGIGPTMAARLAQSADISVIMKLIVDQDAAGLGKLAKGLGEKKAKAIITQLASQLNLSVPAVAEASAVDLMKALNMLGHNANPRECAVIVTDHPTNTTAQNVNTYLTSLRK